MSLLSHLIHSALLQFSRHLIQLHLQLLLSEVTLNFAVIKQHGSVF